MASYETLVPGGHEKYAEAIFQGVKTVLAEKVPVVGKGINLLDNWYFLDPINQRGLTEYTGTTYTIDRWFKSAESNSAYVNADGISTSAQSLYLRQMIENPALLAGNTVTATILLNNNRLFTCTEVYQEGKRFNFTGTALRLVNTLASYPNELFGFQLSETTDRAIAVKVELGDTQTLAHQDANNNWVLNDPPPNKQQELAKCQRYYLPLVQTAYAGRTYSSNDTGALFTITTPVTMRTTPTFTSNGRPVVSATLDTNLFLNNPTVSSSVSNVVRINGTLSDTLGRCRAITVEVTNAALSAEL